MIPDNPRFLVIDDEPEMCWVIQHILHSRGWRSDRAGNGREALAKLAREPYPMAFLDVKLPDMQGMELARKIRALAPQTRIVFVSGFHYKNDPCIRQALDEGLITDFIGKPFDNEAIVRVIQSVMPEATT